MPSVVTVRAKHRDGMIEGSPASIELRSAQEFFQEMSRQAMNLQPIASGAIVREGGYIVTAADVVENAASISVVLPTGQVLGATKVGEDRRSGLAVIKAEANGGGLPAIPWSDSDEPPLPGSPVLAIGNLRNNLPQSVSFGVVAGVHRHPRLIPGGYEDFIQTDAFTGQEARGGVLVDDRGRVVGILIVTTSLGQKDPGPAFAIPASMARWIVDELIVHGKVSRGFLGVGIEGGGGDIGQYFDLEGGGTVVTQVLSDSPASRAGIQVGDVIVTLDGIRVRTPEALRMAVARKTPGKSVQVGLRRTGGTRMLDIVIAMLPDNM
jgi:S1-C subfamily serine protease